MSYISKIEQQKKNKNRFNIYLKTEGQKEEYAFSVDDDLLVKMKLSKGLEIDDLAIMEIQYRDHVQKAFQSAVTYLSYKIRSEKEIIHYLTEKEWEEAVVDEVIHKLREYKYINDEEYAMAFVRTQMNVAKKGPDVIHRELVEKGIEETSILQAMNQYTAELQMENARNLSLKTLNKNKGSMKVTKQKTIQYLVRKGFSMTMAASVVDEMAEEDTETEWNELMKNGRKFHRKYRHLDDFQYAQKMKSSLFRKGFEMDMINRFVGLGKESIENEEFDIE